MFPQFKHKNKAPDDNFNYEFIRIYFSVRDVDLEFGFCHETRNSN